MKKTFTLVAILSFFSCLSAQADDTARLSSLLTRAQAAWSSVQDYTAVFQKQERSGSELGPQETIFLKFEKPFKIFMGWTNTHKQGLQVLYERGRHDGKLAVHKPGLLLGLAPVIFLEQDSPWVKEGSESYDIEDAGIGSFLEDLIKTVEKGAEEGKLDVAMSSDAGGDLADITFTGSAEDAGYFAKRVVVHFDFASSLPGRMELFDWQDEPMGVYAYEDIQLNVGPKDAEFLKIAHRKLARLYLPVGVASPNAGPVKNYSPKTNR